MSELKRKIERFQAILDAQHWGPYAEEEMAKAIEQLRREYERKKKSRITE